MIKTLTHPVFLAASMMAIANQLLEQNGIFLPIIHSYLDDILCFPIVFTVGLAVYRIIIPTYTLSPWHMWPLFVIYILIFEIYLPKTSAIYTADSLDVLAYLGGILLFQFTINQSPKQITAG